MSRTTMTSTIGSCVAKPTTTTTKSTPPGFNKTRRDQCKFLLGVTSVLLLTGGSMASIVTAAAAILCIKEAKIASTKNMKWMSCSFVTFGAALSSFILAMGSDFVDEDKAYGLKISLWLGAKSVQTGWGVTLALFLVSTFTSTRNNNEVSAVEHKQQ